MPAVFVTGTDTGCGKTFAATALLHALTGRGETAVGYKPIAAGCEQVGGEWRNEDALSLLKASSPGFAYDDVNPVALEPPIAPHLALRDLNRQISADQLVEQGARLATRSEWLVVEGAGGFLVPLNERESLADLPRKANWPVILVVGMRLGCINHALLTAEAVRRRAHLLGWVANVLPPTQDRLDDNIQSLQARLDAPCLGILTAETPREAARQWNMRVLYQELKR